MRYEVRWSNGYWKLFDVRRYASVALFGDMRDALDACECANGREVLRPYMLDASGRDGYAPGS